MGFTVMIKIRSQKPGERSQKPEARNRNATGQIRRRLLSRIRGGVCFWLLASGFWLSSPRLLSQSPSLDSLSPKERQAAVEQMAVRGKTEAIPPLVTVLKKEPRS